MKELKLYVLLLDDSTQILEYCFGGVYTSEDLAKEQAMKMDGDWYIEECYPNKPPIGSIDNAIKYLEEFGYKVTNAKK